LSSTGHTALWQALALPELKIASCLVERGCDMDLCTPTGETMLHDAIQNNNERVGNLISDL
jgi:ankyrin repeat protein